MSKTEDWFGYWAVRIRDPWIFTRIRTPDWASHAATVMTKEWLASAEQEPHLLPDSAFAHIELIRGSTAKDKSREGQAHTRQGQMSTGKWVTQSVLIPQLARINKDIIDIPDHQAHDIACYIATRLDSSDDVPESPYCGPLHG